VRDKEPWPQSEADGNELWRKRVKGDWLRLKLGGKTDAAIRETLDKRYENVLSALTNTRATTFSSRSWTPIQRRLIRTRTISARPLRPISIFP
jgi:C-terminal processing protease CtpA/Prc